MSLKATYVIKFLGKLLNFLNTILSIVVMQFHDPHQEKLSEVLHLPLANLYVASAGQNRGMSHPQKKICFGGGGHWINGLILC